MKNINMEVLNQINRSIERLNEFINKDAPETVIKAEICLLIDKLNKLSN